MKQGSAPSPASNLWDLRVFEAASPASSIPKDQSEECVQVPSKLEKKAIPTHRKQLYASQRASAIKLDANGTQQLATWYFALMTCVECLRYASSGDEERRCIDKLSASRPHAGNED